jgi:transcriptional regulator with XRE-family HTH domain
MTTDIALVYHNEMTISPGTGSSLRTVRSARGMSLSEVSSRAGISTATLSRIETEKQSVDVNMLIVLARILRVSPSDLITDGGEHDSEKSLVDALAVLAPEERAKVVTAASRRHASRRPAEPLHAQLEALLATIDMIKEELTAIQRQTRRRRR